jgi:hypothetical protein
MGRGRQSGQAAVEGIGITVLVALLVGATAVWLLHHARPPGEPPPVIARAAQPLEGAYDPDLWAGASGQAYRALAAQTGGDRPLGRALRSVGRGLMAAVALEQEAEGAFHAGARARLRERLAALLDDPVGGLTTVPDPADLSPTAIALRPLGNIRDLWDYAQYVRTLQPREAMRVVSYDAGAAGTDVLIDLVEAYVRKRVARAAGRGAPAGQTRAP